MNTINQMNYENIRIQDLDISVRLKNVLLNNEILYLNQLLEYPIDEIYKFRNVGTKTLDEVVYLKEHPDYLESLIQSCVSIKNEYENIKIQDLDISYRLKKALLNNGILNYYQLLDCPVDQIYKIRSLGRKSLKEVIDLKKKPQKVKKLITIDISEEETDNFNEINTVRLLEKQIEKDFIDDIYSDFSYKDINISYRLRRCLFQNQINTVPEFLEMPIEKLERFPTVGNKLLKEIIAIKLKLLDINNSENTTEILYLLIKKITREEPKTVIFIKNYLLKKTNYNIENFVNDINKLKSENKIELSMNGIKAKLPSILYYVNTIEDGKRKCIITMRLNGATLQEIGDKEGVTRERIRQISTKFFEEVPNVEELKYKDIFEKYSFTEEDFCKIYNESRITYNYLKIVCNSGDESIISGIETGDFTDYQKNIIKKIKNIITVYGKKCSGSKNEIINILAEKNALNGMTTKEFTKIYNKFVIENPNISLDVSDEHNIEAVLIRQENILFDIGHKFRYVDMSLIDKSSIDSLMRLLELEDGYYSTLVIFKNNIELMKELDIRSEYELHSFLKKKQSALKNVRFDRMPNLSIGGIEKEEFTLNKINELSPIAVNEFLDFIEKNYGHKSNSFLSYMLSKFGNYIDKSIIHSDILEIRDETVLELRKIFIEPVYSLDLVNAILKTNGYSNIEEIITKNTMKKIGYKIRSSYILREDYESVEDYFTYLSKTIDFIPNENILGSSTYSASIKLVEKNYDIVLISDKEFITSKKLSEIGITKEMLEKFCSDVLSAFQNITYFTIYNIKEVIDTTWIEEKGFEDIFYECLVETIANTKYLRINNQKIYSFIDDNVEVEDIINEFMIEESIDLDELVDNIREKYGISVSPYKLINSNKFYSKELNKLYLDKDSYYREVYNYE